MLASRSGGRLFAVLPVWLSTSQRECTEHARVRVPFAACSAIRVGQSGGLCHHRAVRRQAESKVSTCRACSRCPHRAYARISIDGRCTQPLRSSTAGFAPTYGRPALLLTLRGFASRDPASWQQEMDKRAARKADAAARKRAAAAAATNNGGNTGSGLAAGSVLL